MLMQNQLHDAKSASIACKTSDFSTFSTSLCSVFTRDVLIPVHLHCSQGVSKPTLYNKRVGGLSTASNYM